MDELKYDVLLCEQDLSGNIDKFMDENVPISDVVFFLGTNKSVFNSLDCAHELDLSKKHQVAVFPMKGIDVTWEDMNSIGLSQDPGIECAPDEFERVCEQLYDYVKTFYNEHPGLFKVKKSIVEEKIIKAKEEIDEKAAIANKRDEEIPVIISKDFNWDAFMALLEYIVESEDLKMFHETKEKEITTIIEKLKSGSLSDADFLVQISQLYTMWFE